MKTPEWQDVSPKQDGLSWLMQCDGFWITLTFSSYPVGYILNCEQVGIKDDIIKNGCMDQVKLLALQRIDEKIGSINRAAKRLKVAELAQSKIVFK